MLVRRFPFFLTLLLFLWAGVFLSEASNGRTDAYDYDFDNRLITLNYQTDSNAAKRGEFRYTYDHRTRRVTRDESSISGGVTTGLSFSGGLSVQEIEGTTVTRHYIRGSDWGGGVGGILYTLRNGVFSANTYDSRGDVVTRSNASGQPTWQGQYEAFGSRVAENGENKDRQRANTKDEDPTGLLNEGFRYRDLEAGIFITRDPLGFVDGPNVYTYVKQNPWTSFDPEGLETIEGYEKQIKALEAKRVEKLALAKKDGYTRGAPLIPYVASTNLQISNAKDKIKNIIRTARTVEEIARIERGTINERELDDTSKDFKDMNEGLWKRNIPGAPMVENIVHKEWKELAGNLALEAAMWIAGGQIAKGPAMFAGEMTGEASNTAIRAGTKNAALEVLKDSTKKAFVATKSGTRIGTTGQMGENALKSLGGGIADLFPDEPRRTLRRSTGWRYSKRIQGWLPVAHAVDASPGDERC